MRAARLPLGWASASALRGWTSVELVRLNANNRLSVRKSYQTHNIADCDGALESKRAIMQLINPFVATLLYVLAPALDNHDPNSQRIS
jgi:hypothetical protein